MKENTGVKVCPNCGFANSSGADKCAMCYLSFEQVKQESRHKRTFQFSFATVAALSIVIASLGYVLFGGANPNAVNEIAAQEGDISWKSEDHSEKAYMMMCEFVKEKCPTPGTALFAPINAKDVSVQKKDECSYEIRAYVECDSKEGLRCRSEFFGTVNETNFAQWKLQTIVMGEWEKL